jgi:hypothetical protein
MDNGETWEPKQLLFESNDLVTDNTYRRMAVSGNTVHIAVNHYEGSWYGVLTYIRSTSNGAGFEQPVNIFTAAGAYHVYDVYVSARGNKAVIGFRHQCNWCVNNSYNLKTSDDNGETFSDAVVYATASGSSWKVSEMQLVGDNIYVLYSDSYYYYGLQYSRLYVASSSDGGDHFSSARISSPAKNGEDKTYGLQDEHYVPKIAGVGNTVSVIWSGLDSNDVHSIFYCRSGNSGATWEAARNLTAGTLAEGQPLQAGLETLAAGGSHVYTLFVSTAANVYLRRSTDGGLGFSGLQGLTTDTPYTEQGWWPVIKIDPTDTSGASVFALWTFPTYVYSRDGGATFTKPGLVIPYLSLGNFAGAAQYPQMVIGQDGKLHYVVSAQYYTTALCGGYCDFDIVYGSIPRPLLSSGGNQALKVDSTDANRYDNMHVPASQWLNFSSKLTVELWVKAYAGGVTTGTSSVVKPIVHKQATGGYQFAYALETIDAYGQRKAAAQIRTSEGEYWVYPSDSKEGLVPDGAWTHLAMSYDAAGGADNLKLYMNGRLIATASASGDLVTEDGLFFAGRYGIWELDELRLWARVRTQTEITGTLYTQLTGSEPDLNAYYDFDGTTEDITGHGNDGILMYKEQFVFSSITGAPSALSASAASGTQINLSWTDNAAGETGFKVERKTGASGTWEQIGTTGANATTYGATGLTAGTTYYFRVRATSAGGDSDYSNEASATPALSGDVNGDGLINCMDVIAVINHILGQQPWPGADLNGDGVVNVRDVMIVIGRKHAK